MSENSSNTPKVREPRELSKAAPILRNNAPRIVSGMRMVPMDKVVTPIPGKVYTSLAGGPAAEPAVAAQTPPKTMAPAPAPVNAAPAKPEAK
jgi:hypothetical protein